MAISYSDADFGTLYIPGSYVDVKVQNPNSGVAANGVLMLVGEADAGPSYSDETDISLNYFGPDQLASVITKYQSGNLVDAFRTAASAANDPNIQGAPTRIFISKTNVSTKATGTLSNPGFATAYGTLADKNYGAAGNLINASVSASASEVAPTTGAFTFIPSPNATAVGVRVNGQARQVLSVSAKTAPSTLVGTVESSAGTAFNSLTISGLNTVMATGGLNRGTVDAGMVASGQTLAVAVSGPSVTITVNTGSWAVTPSVGDTMIIPASGEYGAGTNSAIKGTSNLNYGSYVVTAATGSTITATKLRDNSGAAVTNPEVVGAIDIAAVTDLMIFSPVVVTNTSGQERSILTGLVGQTVTGTASGQTLTLTLQTGAQWAALPQAGDLMLIPATAPSVWRASNTNGGWYTVTSATSGTGAGASTIVMTRISNGAPTSFVATAIAAVTDLRDLRPDVDGLGKSLELFDGGGAENISTPGEFYGLSITQVTWISTALAPRLLTSTTEYLASLNVARSADNFSESLTGDASIALRVGYNGGGTSATITGTMTISGTTLTTSVSGGTGSNLTVDLTKYRTLNDLAVYINSQTGYKALVGTALLGQQLTTYKDTSNLFQTVLDKGTYGIASVNGTHPGRVKMSAYALYRAISGSQLVQLNVPAASATSGQPAVQVLFFLSGGAKGATSNARVTGAIDAMKRARGNFLITCFSADATSDIANGLTDPASTYAIDDINAYVKSHVLQMSTKKIKRWRQGFLSKQTTFTGAKLASNNIAAYRCSMNFQDFKAFDSTGTIKQFQPWMGAVYAAAMQAAGFYKGITFKFINTSGVVMADGSFSDQDPSQVEDALRNGLLVAEKVETGGYRWVSDQTTYGVDNNFVYNSIQAVYGADLIAATLGTDLENAFVGQSLADVTAGVILTFVQAEMAKLIKLKLVAASDDAPLGYRNLSVKLNGPAALVTIEVKEATTLYFIPVSLSISQITQTASA